MKFVLIPDSFKGTASSEKICGIMKECVESVKPGSTVMCIPVADGGEGSVDAFLTAFSGKKIYKKVCGPDKKPVDAFYGLIEEGKTAVIEMASCAGLSLMNVKNPLTATTYGVGELINDAAAVGVSKIIMCLGGSATNDGGCGAAAACGVRFYDGEGREFVPAGGTAEKIARIDMSGINTALAGIEFVTMCDVKNPPYGKEGASYVFGPQKGATPETAELLDRGIKNLCSVIDRDLGKKLDSLPGGGAAGAMGMGMCAFFGSELKSGIETLLDAVKFDSVIEDADYVVTGEGNFDGQSLNGKVVDGVAAHTLRQNKKLIVLAGGINDRETEKAYEMGVTAVFSINRKAEDFEKSAPKTEENLRSTFENILRLI